MARYHCEVHQRAGFGVSWTETNKRRAFAAVRERVAEGYQDDEDGSVTVELDDGTEETLARWVNEGGRAMRVNV